MIIKVVKVYLALSLVLCAVWGHFQGGFLCLTSSVCWSLQCLISVLTQGGWWWRAVGGGGCCKLILLACAFSVSSTLGLPLLAVHTTQALRSSTGEPSEAGPRLHAPPECKPLRLSAQEALRGADLVGLGLRFVPFPGPSSSGVWRAQSLRLMAFPCCSVFWEYCWCSFSGR